MNEIENAKGHDGWAPFDGRVKSNRNNAWRLCTVLKVGRVNLKIRYRTPDRGRLHGNTWRPTANPDEIVLFHNDLDSLVAFRTAFKNFDELVNAKGGYKPTISPRDAWDYVLIAAYNAYQRTRNDPRRVYAPGTASGFKQSQAAEDLRAARRHPTEVWK